MTAVVSSLIAEYGLVFLLTVSVLEGAMLLYFAPSESIVPAAVILMGGDLVSVSIVLAFSVVGATLGQYLLFRFSRDRGRSFLLENRWLKVSEDGMARFEQKFQEYGHLAIPITNSMLFVRGTMTIPAGISGMEDSKFVLYSATGTLMFQIALAALTIGIISL